MRPYVRAANLTWGGLDLADLKTMNFSEAESEAYELRTGDVLVAEASGSRDEVGKPALWRGEVEGCCFQNTVVRIRSRGPSPEYLRYFFLGEARSGRIGRASPGVGIHHIGARRLSAWPVPLPPLAEQRRIVAAIEEQFSRLDASLDAIQRVQRRIHLLRRGILTAAFAYASERRPLREFLREPLRNGHSARAAPDGSGIRVLTLTAVTRREFTETNTKLAAVEEKRAESLWLKSGDVFVQRSNTPELVGSAALYRGPERWAVFPDLLIRVRTTNELVPEYLDLYLQSAAARDFFRQRAQGLAGSMPKIDQGVVAALPIPVRSPDEQRRIVADIEQQLSLIASLSAAVDSAQKRNAALRRAILERAFRGELVPRDPDDEPASALLERIRTERAVAKPRRKQQVA
jgi:type I restriction enzyme S subunit